MLQHRLSDLFAVGRAFELLPLVVEVAAFRQTDANLDPASQEVNVVPGRLVNFVVKG